jgi:hypothetical protein
MNHTAPLSTRTPRRRIALRLAVGVLGFFVLGGPSPGYVGGCNRQPADPPSPAQFCVDRDVGFCERDARAGRITADEFITCYEAAVLRCPAAQWREGCDPGYEAIDICRMALADRARDSTLNADIVECRETSICGGAAGALIVDPDGI